MEEYKQHIFYKLKGDISPHIQEEILRDAKDKCYHWHIDHLPTWARERIDMPFDEVLKYLYQESIHFVIIHRRGYSPRDENDEWNKWYLEIGFSTLARTTKLPTTKIDIKGDLFLWINLDEKYIPYFVEKYNLEKR